MLPTSLSLADFAVKGLAILTIAAIAAYTLRRKSAATVHRVWTLGFAAVFLAPAMGLVLPQRSVKVLPPSSGVSVSGAEATHTDGEARRGNLAAAPAEASSVSPRPRETSATTVGGDAAPNLHEPGTTRVAPAIEASAVDELASKPVVFAGLNVDADSDQARALADANGWKWGQTYLGNDSDMARQLAVSSVPAYYLIGPDGKLVASSNEWRQIKSTLETSLHDHSN
jgi:hypothetical protein